MSFKHIVSRDNPVFKKLKKLCESSKERRSEGETLLDGVHLIESYRQIFAEPNMLIIPEGKMSTEASWLMQSLTDTPIIMLPTLMFSELTPVASATGILALITTPQLPLPAQATFVLMLEDIQDPGNLGSMLRTAAAAGVEAAYLSEGCADAWSPKALRGGQGAQFVLAIVERADLINELNYFKGESYATTIEGESLYAQHLSQATAFVMGNEGAGLRQKTLAAASKRIAIPMALCPHGQVESLNVAAAAAICLFERKRQLSESE